MDNEIENQAPVETAEAEPAAEAPEAPASAEAPEAPASAEEGEEAPARPREVIRGIHPELLCECEECEPERTELQFFSPEEEKKVKGTVMLYCARSGRKYFSPAPEFNTWFQANAPKRRGRKDS